MRLQIKTLTPLFFAILVCSALLAVWQTTLRGNESTAALTTGFLFVVSLVFDRYILRLPFATGAMVYFTLLGLFHLGLVVPWALGIYDISRTPSFVPNRLTRSVALINYSIIAFQMGLTVAAKMGKKWSTSARPSNSTRPFSGETGNRATPGTRN